MFDKGGLKALTAASEVLKRGPLRWGADARFWHYTAGVWSPGDDVVHARIVDVLGERYRPAHGNAVEGVLRAKVDRIDCSPVCQYINFTNGLLDWRHPGGPRLIPHDPAIPTTVQLTIPWEPTAECGVFRDFLSDAIPEDDRPRAWEVIGYMLLNGNPLQKAFLLAGGGGNGKGAFMRTILRMFRPEDVSNVPLHELSANKFATAQLFGKVANVCGDIDSTYIEHTGRVKEITGEDRMMAEHKFGQPFYFVAWCSMLFSANEIPGSADSSRGWLRRWEVLPFPNNFEHRVDRTLEPRIQSPESLQGIAAAGVAALRVLMDRQAFRTTDTGEAAKDEFARKSNPILGWLDEECTVTGATEDFERGGLLYEEFKKWAEAAGLRVMSRPKFYERLRQFGHKGITSTKRNGIDGFKGVHLGKLTPTAPAPEPAPAAQPAFEQGSLG